jgi:flagellar export protein FliJ
MPFRFSLDGLLRFRQSQERREELLLGSLNHSAAELREQRSRLVEWVRGEQDRRLRSLAAGAAASELQFDVLCDAQAELQRQELETRIRQAEERIEAQRGVLIGARRQRQLLENLRERQFLSFRVEQSRREQRRLDELFLLQRSPARVCPERRASLAHPDSHLPRKSFFLIGKQT